MKKKLFHEFFFQDEVDDLRQRMSKTQNDLNLSMGENERLSEELTRYRHFLNIFNFTNFFPPNFLIIYFKNS